MDEWSWPLTVNQCKDLGANTQKHFPCNQILVMLTRFFITTYICIENAQCYPRSLTVHFTVATACLCITKAEWAGSLRNQLFTYGLNSSLTFGVPVFSLCILLTIFSFLSQVFSCYCTCTNTFHHPLSLTPQVMGMKCLLRVMSGVGLLVRHCECSELLQCHLPIINSLCVSLFPN